MPRPNATRNTRFKPRHTRHATKMAPIASSQRSNCGGPRCPAARDAFNQPAGLKPGPTKEYNFGPD